MHRFFVSALPSRDARCAIRIDRPDLFAAALLFVPDYDPAQMAKLSKANLWIVSSEEDEISYPKMATAMDNLKSAGAHIARAEWNGQANSSQLASDVDSTIKQGANIKFSVLKKGTSVPAGVTADTANIHAYTWRIGYSIRGLRDWLFTQKK
jgi:predicted peptidase